MLDVIKNRRSVRRFTAERVFKDDLENLLRSAMQAPTAMNVQDWRFLATINKDDLSKVATFHKYLAPFNGAKAGIVVMADRTKFEDERYSYVDAGICVENILLEVVNVGLGAVVCAIGPDNEKIRCFKEYFDLPENYLPVAAIAIGYPADSKNTTDRYDPDKVIWRL